jgi:hypothetical protein
MNAKVSSLVVAALCVAALATQPVAARADVKVDFDKTFDFKSVRTWAWNSPQPGEVKMARTATDDPEVMRRRAEPIILDAMAFETSRRGLQPASSVPDILVTYYLLMTITTSAQTLGQFVPAVAEWGLPPFEGATQSLKLMNRGSLVLDLSAKGTVVWRGVAQAEIKFDADDRKREALLRRAVRDLLSKYPPKR